ncbi:MAG: nucleotidyl transferase AbiEii/AbiGii toxin family protein [Erysipelotrichaceae bacterium]
MNDLGASILFRLKNKAKESNLPYQQCIQLFFQEEFLRRLSKSEYSQKLVLKGGHFIYALTNFDSRPTSDIDFLLRDSSNDVDHINKVIIEIIETPTGHNEIVLLKANEARRISLHREYPGVSIQITGQIKNVRILFDIDIGVGDIISPAAEKRTLVTQLDGYSSIEVFTYSLESTIAEKLDAILQRFELTSRMKDFYDIYYLSMTFDFEGKVLQKAIHQTLMNRKTHFDRDSLDRIVRLSGNADMLIKWRYFLKTIRSQNLSFTEVIQDIDSFLRPVWMAILNENEMVEKWDCTTKKWFHL